MEPVVVVEVEPETKPTKAILAAIGTFAAALGTALSDGSMEAADWAIVIPAAVVVGGLVWAIRNKPKDPPVV